jgi:bacterioferritin-associated ferredoxin
MDADNELCLCFHITRRKLVNYARIHQLKVASQLSQCGGAGTGCGWCIPYLKQIFAASQGGTIDTVSAKEYAQMRASYVRSGGGKPPPGAAPLPEEEPERNRRLTLDIDEFGREV